MSKKITRRGFLKNCSTLSAGTFLTSRSPGFSHPNPRTSRQGEQVLEVDSTPGFELSPYLYMQFMEPLGATEGSVATAWDLRRADWRPDVLKVTKRLAPTLIRWGGCFTSYYRWKEGVGPRSRRRPMHNLAWGGMESNQVGTHEFVDFCRRVGAEPMLGVNFESDGRACWTRPAWWTD